MKTMLRKIGFFTAFIIPGLVVLGFNLGNLWNFLPLLFSFFVLPVIDHFIGTDTSNVSEVEANVMGEEFYYRFVTFVWTYFQVAFVVWGAYAVTTGKIDTVVEGAGFVISFSLVTGGIGITVAHELGHKKSTLERFYSKLLLITVCYGHFYIEHNRGHHVAVATPQDPATARRDESFYHFWFRSVFLGYAHAWNLEKESLHPEATTHPEHEE